MQLIAITDIFGKTNHFQNTIDHISSIYDSVEIISKKSDVKCFKSSYLHGFMNEKSKNYNQLGYNKYLKIIKIHD